MIKNEEFNLTLIQANNLTIDTMVQLDNYHITPDDDYPDYQYQDGLGLVSGFEIEVHYCHSDIQEAGLRRVIKEKQLPTYTIPNDGGLLVNEHQIQTFGTAALVQRS